MVVIAERDGVCLLKKIILSHEQPVMCMKNSVLESLDEAASVM